MDKPVKRSTKKEYYNYLQVRDYIEFKYNIKTRDYFDSHNHFKNYLKKYNLPIYSYALKSDGTYTFNGEVVTAEEYYEYFEIAQEQYAEYNEWQKIPGNECPPCLDFWHWICDHYDISNGTYFTLCVKDAIEDNEEEQFVRDICKLIYDEFQEDVMTFWIEW
jgi:hypothetical protein